MPGHLRSSVSQYRLFITSHEANDTGGATSCQSTIQMYVATVDDHMLPGYMTGLRRHEKQNIQQFVRFGHPLA